MLTKIIYIFVFICFIITFCEKNDKIVQEKTAKIVRKHHRENFAQFFHKIKKNETTSFIYKARKKWEDECTDRKIWRKKRRIL